MKTDKQSKVVTRFAPSPTGDLHIGGVRTALYGWLLARQNDGKFILRIEDTDKAREVEGGVDIIKNTLQALSLSWDEFHLQSELKDVHRAWAQKLYDSGLAYADDIRPEEVEAWRQDAKLKKKPFLYRDYIADDRKVEWIYGQNVLRLKSEPKRYNWHDEARGDLSAGPEAIDDLVLIKADGYPTYNFAHIIDDHEMGVTHILRADEFISSTPKYLSIYETLGFEHPKFVTLPPIMAPGGKKKLGKRDGAKSSLEYLEDGILPEALLNFLALLGWNPGKGDNQEIFTVNELIEKFSIEGIGKSGANYGEDRLKWINGHHIRALKLDDLYSYATGHPELISGSNQESSSFRAPNFMPGSSSAWPESYQKQVLSLVQERLKLLSEIPDLTWFFFEKPELKKDQLLDVKGLEGESQAKEFISHTLNLINQIPDDDFTSENIQAKLNQALEDLNTKPKVLFALLRNALTGAKFTPSLNDTMAVLGKEEVNERLDLSLEELKD
jgi:glutamyl-tRNA synthetase